MTNRAVFLDKDGTLIEDVPYNVDPEQIRLTTGAGEGLQQLQRLGYQLIVISNQAGVARGYFPESALAAVEARLQQLLKPFDVSLAGFYYCPHHPDGTVMNYAIACQCRKPEPGLLLQAAHDRAIDLAQSWFIGDILNDVEAGRRAGCQTILINNGNETEWLLSSQRTPHFMVMDLAEAARVIEQMSGDRVISSTAAGVSNVTRSQLQTQSAIGATRMWSSTPIMHTNNQHSMSTSLSNLIHTFADRHIAVIGEAMLDSYLIGEATRLCQEAPVPVVALHDRLDRPGGAANVAVNLRSLGARVSLLSVIGDDMEGALLRHALERCDVETGALLVEPRRRTLVKSRVMAAFQLLVRMDQGSTEAIAPEIEEQLIQRLTDLFLQCDAVVISDYSYGILTPRVLEAIAHLQAQTPKLVVVDSKRLASYQSIGVTVVKPNYEEAYGLLTQTSTTLDAVDTRIDRIARHRDQLLDRTGAQFAVVTLDVDGAVILQRERSPHQIQAKATVCKNTTGAGDTFISALTLALTVGVPIATAVELAVTAAAVVVAKDGTATCSAEELQTAIDAEPIAASQLEPVQTGTALDGEFKDALTKEVA